MARHYRTDLARNSPVSTEITGYAASALVYLHAVTGDAAYLDRARAAARFLIDNLRDGTMPFEVDPPSYAYFFDCGIVVRGLLAVSRATGDRPIRDAAAALGRSMAADFAAGEGRYHPVVSLPDKRPLEYDAGRWSRSPGCYQLKAAMAWWDLWEATGDAAFRGLYGSAREMALGNYRDFLPGHQERAGVMDRLHAFLYFLEGLLPAAGEARVDPVIAGGIADVARLLRDIAPEFARCDVYAQLLRLRLYADRGGDAAANEAEALAGFQAADGGFYFGRKHGVWLPHVSPVATAFAIQALEMWRGGAPRRHELI